MENAKSEFAAPIPTPHWGSQSGAAFTVLATAIIKAPPITVLDALLDTSTWPRWNNFVPRVSVLSKPKEHDNGSRLQPDMLFKEHVDMAGRGRSTFIKMKLLMTVLEEIREPELQGFRVVWLGKGYPDWALRSERVHEIYQVDAEGDTTYKVYETFSGPLAWFVKVFVGTTLVRRFGQWNGELKGFIEKTT